MLNMSKTKRSAVARVDVPDLAGSVLDDKILWDILTDAEPSNVDITKREVRFADNGATFTSVRTRTTTVFYNLSGIDQERGSKDQQAWGYL